jgi:hypothetical protein
MVRGLAPGIPRAPKATARDGPWVSPGRPWRARFSPARRRQGGPGQNCPGTTWRDFRQPVPGFNFCLWVWHAAEAPLEGRRDAARTTASASFGLRPLHLNGHFYPVKVIWVVLVNPVCQAFRKNRALPAIRPPQQSASSDPPANRAGIIPPELFEAGRFHTAWVRSERSFVGGCRSSESSGPHASHPAKRPSRKVR